MSNINGSLKTFSFFPLRDFYKARNFMVVKESGYSLVSLHDSYISNLINNFYCSIYLSDNLRCNWNVDYDRKKSFGWKHFEQVLRNCFPRLELGKKCELLKDLVLKRFIWHNFLFPSWRKNWPHNRRWSTISH